ncbi:MAG: hypothetical protein QM775_29045 [Pirellulales bacterium]
MRRILLTCTLPAVLAMFAAAADEPLGNGAQVASPPVIAGWIRELDAPTFVRREAAGRRLLDLGREAVEPIAAAVEQPLSLEAVQHAMRVLEGIAAGGDPETTVVVKQTLVRLARSKNVTTAAKARESLRNHQQRILALLERCGAAVEQNEGVVYSVSFDSARVLGENLKLLHELPDIIHLSCGTALMDDAGLAAIAGLPKLRELNLFQASITDAGLKHLRSFPELRRVPMGFTNVTDRGLAELKDLTQLEYIGLRGDQITDAGLPQLKNLVNLTGLHLGETKVTDAGLPHLYGFKKLQTLSIWQTKATEAGFAELRKQLPQAELRTTSQ